MKNALIFLPLLASVAYGAPQKRQEVSCAASSAVASASAAMSMSASASAAAPSGSADFATGLVAALRARGATTLASLVEPLAPQLGPVLQNGEWTLLAPSNDALSGVDTSNTTALAQILMYHVLYGNLPASSIPENMSVIPATLLQGAPAVNLPNNAAQAVALTKNQFGTTEIIGQNTTVLANATYQNILVKLVDNVLTIPSNVTGVLADPRAANASALVSLAAQISPDTVNALATTAGLTVFAPSNAAVSAIAGSIGSVDSTAITTVLQGHVLPQVVYSTNITDGLSATTLNGGMLSLAVNATGVFVTSNNATAQVIETDFIAANGVVHVIDRVLFAASAASPSGAASMSMSASMSASA